MASPYKILLSKIIFFLLPVSYFLYYGRTGLDDIDGGYVVGLAYRVLNGELPYRDIIILRPPLFVYLHTITQLIFPASFVLLAERFLFYIIMAVISWLSVNILKRYFDFETLKINPWLLSVIIFVFSVHNFPPLPWPTVDGILLGVIGLWFLTGKKELLNVAIGILFLFLSALTKQSFYPLPIAGILFLLLQRSRKDLLIGIITLFVCIVGVYCIMERAGIWDYFIFWTTGSAKFHDLVESGIKRYLRFHVLSEVVILAVVFITMRKLFIPALKKKIEPGWLLVAYFAFIFFSIILRTFHPGGLLFHVHSDYPQVLFLVTAGIIGTHISFPRFREDMVVLALLLLVSWCSSISWSYQTPLLFSAPFIFGVIYLAANKLNFSRIGLLTGFILLGALVAFSFASNKAYGDGYRYELTYDMGKVFKKLSGIRSDQNTLEKYTELRDLVKKYGTVFKTLPSMPLSNYLTDTRSPIGADWPMDIELNGHVAMVIRQLNKSGAIVFAEKNPVFNDTEGRWVCSLKKYVKTEWQLLEETKYFQIYKRP